VLAKAKALGTLLLKAFDDGPLPRAFVNPVGLLLLHQYLQYYYYYNYYYYYCLRAPSLLLIYHSSVL
jgi:hypothetical protein